MSLETSRLEFEQDANRSLAMPIAGTIIWAVIGVLSLLLDERSAVYMMLFATGGILPIALIIAKIRSEKLLTATNPLAKLMGACVLMVNLLWAVHIPLVLQAPQFVPLSLGIALGLHWIVYSWIIQHPLGTIHAITRTLLVLLAWALFPDIRIFAVAMAIVLTYLISLYQMTTRNLVLASA